MARPSGSKVVLCPEKKCKGRIVAKVGEKGKCPRCGAELRFTQKLMKELGKI